MGLISKIDLWIIFREYLIRKEKESHIVSTSSNYTLDTPISDVGYSGKIFFYEWSDLNRTPLVFYSLSAFNEFLKKSNIFLVPFQRDLIRDLSIAYITCKKGKPELVIRGTRPGLLEAMSENVVPPVGNNLPSVVNPMSRGENMMLPYHTSIAYAPGDDRRGMGEYSYNGNPEEWYD